MLEKCATLLAASTRSLNIPLCRKEIIPKHLHLCGRSTMTRSLRPIHTSIIAGVPALPFPLQRPSLPQIEAEEPIEDTDGRNQHHRPLRQKGTPDPEIATNKSRNQEETLNQKRRRIVAQALFAAEQRTPLHTVGILKAAHDSGIYLKPSAYESVVHQYATTKAWSAALSIIALAKKHLGRTTVRLLNWKVTAYAELRHYRRLVETQDEFASEHLKPTARTFHILLSAHISNQELTHARGCLHMMTIAGLDIDVATHMCVVKAYRSLGLDEEVESRAFLMLRGVGSQSDTQLLNSLLQLAIETKDTSSVERFCNLYDQRLLRLHPSQSRSAIEKSESSLSFSSSAVVTETDDIPPTKPDVSTFSRLVKFYGSRRYHNLALHYFHQMREIGLLPTSEALAALVRTHVSVKNYKAAVTIVAENCLVEGTQKWFRMLGANPREGRDLQIMPPIPVSIEVFNELLFGVLAQRGLRGMRVLLHIMFASKASPNEDTLKLLMSYLDRSKKSRPRELVRIMKQLSTDRLRPNLSHVNVILRNVLSHEMRILKAGGWVASAHRNRNKDKRSRYSRLFPRVGTLDRLDPTGGIMLPRRGGSAGSAMPIQPIVQSLSSKGVRSGRSTLAMRIRYDGVARLDVSTAEKVFKMLPARGIRQNEYHYSALMEGYAEVGDMGSAEKMLRQAVKAGIALNVVMFTILIVGYGRIGRPDKASKTFQSMLDADVAPDAAAIDALAKSFYAVRSHGLARQTIIDLWPLIAPFPESLRDADLKTLANQLRAIGDEQRAHRADRSLRKLNRDYFRHLRWKMHSVLQMWKSRGKGRRRRRVVIHRGYHQGQPD